MAWGNLGGRGSANDKTAGTTILMTVATATIDVDEIAIVAVVSDNRSATGNTNDHSSLADSAGNVWTKLREETRSAAGVAADGVTSSIWATKVTTQMVSGSTTITCTFAGSITASAIACYAASVAGGNTFQFNTHFVTVGATTAMTNSPSGLASAEHLYIAAIGYEGPTTAGFTIDADMTAILAPGTTGSTANTNVTLRMARRIATETGFTNTPTNGSATDWVNLIVVLDEVAAGTAHSKTPADTIGALDDYARVQAAILTPADAIGATDSRTRVQAAILTPADTIGVLDSRGKATGKLARIELLGMTDSATRSGGKTNTDVLGLLDAATRAYAGVRSPTDPIGAVDSRIEATIRTLIDSLEIVDAATHVIVLTKTAADTLGLLDPLARGFGRTLSDTLGLLDAATRAAVMQRPTTDVVGLVDSRSKATGRGIQEVVGLSDAVGRASARALVELLGLTDSRSKAVGKAARVELLGITDTRSRAMARERTDPIGLLDAATRAAAALR